MRRAGSSCQRPQISTTTLRTITNKTARPSHHTLQSHPHAWLPQLVGIGTLLRSYVPRSPHRVQNVFGTPVPGNTSPSGTQCRRLARHTCIKPLVTSANHLAGAQQDAQKEECQEGNPVLPDGLRCLRNRPDNFCEHALRQAGSWPQGGRRPDRCARRGGRQDQAHHRWYVAPMPAQCPQMAPCRSDAANSCPQSSTRRAPASRSPSSTLLVSETRLTMRPGRIDLVMILALAYRHPASQRSSDISSDSTTVFSLRNRESSVTLDSEMTVYTSSCTSSHQLVTG